MITSNLRQIGNNLYEKREDGLLHFVRKVAPDAQTSMQPAPQVGLLDIGSNIPERLSLVNDLLNPIAALPDAMEASQRMFAPNATGMERVAAGGDMLSGMAGVLAPVAGAVRAGTSGARALMEGLLGGSPTTQAAGDVARNFAADESGALRLFPGDYLRGHMAPEIEQGATLDNPVTMFGGNDIYTPKARQYFGTGNAQMDNESLKIIQNLRQNPDADVTIYRAISNNLPNEIGAGDWVTINKNYAKLHGESVLNGDYKIVAEKVKAKELATEGDIHEWGWWPSDARVTNALEGRMGNLERNALEQYARQRGLLSGDRR
jgi:hypothetical protein